MPKNILIVDDSLYMRTMIQGVVSQAGYEISGMAANGETAIDMALEQQPDLITLDIILPDMIGTDILKVLKQEEGIKSVIVMVSAVGQQSVIEEGLRLGAAAYITKPFTPDQLIEVIENVLEAEGQDNNVW